MFLGCFLHVSLERDSAVCRRANVPARLPPATNKLCEQPAAAAAAATTAAAAGGGAQEAGGASEYVLGRGALEETRWPATQAPGGPTRLCSALRDAWRAAGRVSGLSRRPGCVEEPYRISRRVEFTHARALCCMLLWFHGA
jgi:hypothetical protein